MKKTIVWILVLALLSVACVLGTIAYLKDEATADNVMTVGKIDIDLLEYERIDTETKDADAKVQEFHDNKPLLPAVIEKGFDYTAGDTYVDWEQIGKAAGYTSPIWDPDKINNEVDKMVFLKNSGDYGAYVRIYFAFEAGNYTTKTLFDDMIHINLNDNDSEWKWEWIPFLASDKDGHNYFIALATYQKPLAAESVTEISLSQIALDSNAINADVAEFDKTYNVLVHAQGIQSDGFGDVPEDALIEGFGRDIPFDMTLAQGVDLYTALHYYGGNKADTKITDKVTSVTFGLNNAHEEIVSNTNNRAVLTSVEQYAEVYTYYVPNATDSTKYDLYVLADDTIYTPKDSTGLFKDMTALTKVDTTNVDVSRTENMTEMFKSCSALNDLDVSEWNVGNVSSMSSMFHGCKNLTTLDVSAWDVSNVTKMNSVFESCSNINNLDVSAWDVSNVSTMSRMFARCNALTELKLNADPDTGAWDVSKVSDMQVMFGWCTNLTCLEMKGWNTGNLTNMYGMFFLCENLRVVDVSDLDTQNVTNMSYMFTYCYSLEEIKGLTNWETISVTTMEKMFASESFYNRFNLIKSLDLSSFDTSNVTNMSVMFQNSPYLETIYVGDGWNTDNVKHSDNMFYKCPLLVGGNGTTIAQIDAIEGIEDTDVTNKTYARVDTAENPGYLTYKPAGNANP